MYPTVYREHRWARKGRKREEKGGSLSAAVSPPNPTHATHRHVPHPLPLRFQPLASLSHSYTQTPLGILELTRNTVLCHRRAQGRNAEWAGHARKTKKTKVRDGQVTKTEKNGICKKRECLETKVFPPVTTSLKRGIINIRSFLQIAPDMQDTSALRAQKDIASDI